MFDDSKNVQPLHTKELVETRLREAPTSTRSEDLEGLAQPKKKVQ
jgi:hypothetical protein